MTLQGILLAAGAGTRMGRPKALVRDDDGEPWLVRGVRTLRDGGCDAVTVVLGAAADEAADLLDGLDDLDDPDGRDDDHDPDPQDRDRHHVRLVRAADWQAGMSASLRAGLAALEGSDAAAAVVSLVDLPDVGPEVVRRVVAAGAGPAALARAAYAGEPGHPVLLGREHWAGVLATSAGDRGARHYLAMHPVVLVECGDLATGRDQDTP